MAETSPTTPVEPGPTRTPTGTIQDQSTSIPPSSTPASQEAKPTTTPPSTETTKPTEAKPADASKDGKSLLNEKSPAQGAPDKYEDFKVPEGFTLDGEVASEASAIFKETNLTQADAQKLVDFYVKHTKQAFEAPFNAYMEKRQEWRDQINADPTMGGSKLNGVKVSIGRLIDSFGDAKVAEAFRDAMDFTGAGDNPAVVRGLFELSKRLTEGTAVRGNGPATTGMREPGREVPSTAQAMYPHLPSNR